MLKRSRVLVLLVLLSTMLLVSACSNGTPQSGAKAEADPASTAPVLPKVIGDAENHRVVLPHEPDYPA